MQLLHAREDEDEDEVAVVVEPLVYSTEYATNDQQRIVVEGS